MRIEWHTEEPPKEEEYYLVTYTDGDMDICKWTNASRYWAGKTTEWHWITAMYCEVAAWLPLPKPYKAESEDEG